MAIMILIIIGALMSNSKFSDDLELTNLAYDIAFTIREAQAYGLSVKEWKNNSGISNTDFNAGYGIRFARYDDRGATPAVSGNKKFILFNDVVDVDDTESCKCGFEGDLFTDLAGCQTSSEYIKSYTLPGNNSIKSFKIYSGNLYISGFDFDTNSGFENPVDVIFYRPEPSPMIISSDRGDVCQGESRTHKVSKIEIIIKNDKGATRKIIVNSIGQIRVD
jgi:hypothetical protein